ncbi:hypothetical protein TNCV_2533691 [Trichonephila clavipes]|nr:hypothetical protein TNCV_2533691 [Trichonephila clavipes]
MKDSRAVHTKTASTSILSCGTSGLHFLLPFTSLHSMGTKSSDVNCFRVILNLHVTSVLIVIQNNESVLEPDETGHVIEEAGDLGRQINLEVDSDDVQELLDSHNQEASPWKCISKSKTLMNSSL